MTAAIPASTPSLRGWTVDGVVGRDWQPITLWDSGTRPIPSFHRAWVSLLRDEHVTFDNIERVPALLIAAILGAAAETPLNEDELAAVALAQLKGLEQETSVAVN